MKLTNTQQARLELALMRGSVVSCDEDAVDLVEATRYLLSATQGIHHQTEEEMTETAKEAVAGIHKYDKEDTHNKVKFITIGRIEDMLVITYVLDTGDEYSPCNFLDPRELVGKKDRSTDPDGNVCYWFSYAYNVTEPFCSELGDSFFRMNTATQEVYRVS